MNFPLCLSFLLLAFVHAEDMCEDGTCNVLDSQSAAHGDALLQVHHAAVATKKACSYQLQGDQDGSQPCSALQSGSYISGGVANLDEAGYQDTAKACCHHEMSLFARREIERQGFDICDLTDLHGFVHWYDCNNDNKTFAMMQEEIAGAMTSNCPWLGHLPNCPQKGQNCREFPPCATDFPAGSMAASEAMLDEAGYAAVALRCCHVEMEAFIRREIAQSGFKVCDEGALQGFLHWFDCSDDSQTYARLQEGLVMARSGLPPLCPWLGDMNGESCPPKGHNCPVVEVAEPAAHRRRTACR